MAKLQLSGRNAHLFSLVDDEDYPEVVRHKWYLHTGGYATASIDRRTFYLHRFIANTPADLHTDHINGNKLDNRKENLRVCTHLENMQNIHKKDSRRGCIKKQIMNGRTYWYGELRVSHQRFITTTFDNEEQAKGGLKQMIKDREL